MEREITILYSEILRKISQWSEMCALQREQIGIRTIDCLIHICGDNHLCVECFRVKPVIMKSLLEQEGKILTRFNTLPLISLRRSIIIIMRLIFRIG